MQKLIDVATNEAVEVTYPGLSNEDLVQFLDYFGVRFYSLKALTENPTGPMFRVMTNEYPSRGHDITFHSVATWKAARAEMGPQEPHNGVYLVTFQDKPVRTLGLAQGTESGAETVLIFCDADAPSAVQSPSLRHMAPERFFGVTYDRPTDTYRPNCVFMHRHAA